MADHEETRQCPDCEAEGIGPLPLDQFYSYPNGTPFKYCKRHYTKRQNERRAERLKDTAMAEVHSANRKEHDRKYRQANKAKRTETWRQWRNSNPDNAKRTIEATRRWEESNPDVARLRKIKNYLISRARNAPETRTIKPDAAVCAEYAGKTVQILPDNAEARHVYALAGDVRILVPVDELVYP